MSLDRLWVHRGQKASGYLTIFSMVQGTGNHLLPGKRKCPPGNSDFSNCSCSAQVVELWLHVSELDAVYHKQLSAQMLICQVGLTMFSCAERVHTQAESCLGCTVSTFSCCLTTSLPWDSAHLLARTMVGRRCSLLTIMLIQRTNLFWRQLLSGSFYLNLCDLWLLLFLTCPFNY